MFDCNIGIYKKGIVELYLLISMLNINFKNFNKSELRSQKGAAWNDAATVHLQFLIPIRFPSKIFRHADFGVFSHRSVTEYVRATGISRAAEPSIC